MGRGSASTEVCINIIRVYLKSGTDGGSLLEKLEVDGVGGALKVIEQWTEYEGVGDKLFGFENAQEVFWLF